MISLKAIAQKLFNRTITPEDISLIETADLNHHGAHPHYYTADRQDDGMYTITHSELSQYGDGRLVRVDRDAMRYTLNEAIDLLARFEKADGLFGGKEKSYRLFQSSRRPDYFKEKLGANYQRSEIETEYFGESPREIMRLKNDSYDMSQRAIAMARIESFGQFKI
jgi:hypothetical protein